MVFLHLGGGPPPPPQAAVGFSDVEHLEETFTAYIVAAVAESQGPASRSKTQTEFCEHFRIFSVIPILLEGCAASRSHLKFKGSNI